MQKPEFLFSQFAESLCRTSDCIFSTMASGPIGQFGIGDGENESVFQQILGAIGDAFIRSTQQADNAAKSFGVARAAAGVGQGGRNIWQQFNAAMMGPQAQMA
jgi:hypothetical protein